MVNTCVGLQLTRLASIHSQKPLSEKIHAEVLVESWNEDITPGVGLCSREGVQSCNRI